MHVCMYACTLLGYLFIHSMNDYVHACNMNAEASSNTNTTLKAAMFVSTCTPCLLKSSSNNCMTGCCLGVQGFMLGHRPSTLDVAGKWHADDGHHRKPAIGQLCRKLALSCLADLWGRI